jgi:hypothetical protein
VTALDADRLADRVRNEYLTRKRDTDQIADALDLLHKILAWAETPLGIQPTTAEADAPVLGINAAKHTIRVMAGQGIFPL